MRMPQDWGSGWEGPDPQGIRQPGEED